MRGVAFGLTTALALAAAFAAGCRPEDGVRLRALREIEPPPVEPAPPPAPRLKRVTVNYCSTPTQFKRTRTRVLYVLDRSGSNLRRSAAPNQIGTDMNGARRFGALGQYLQSPEVQALGTDIEFGLLYFSGTDVYPLSQMDRVQIRPQFGRSFVSAAELLGIVEAERPLLQGTPPHQSQSSASGRTLDAGWTDYRMALTKAHDVIHATEHARTAAGDVSEIVYLIAFISDGAPLVAQPGGAPSMQKNADIMAEIDKLTGLVYRHVNVVGVTLHTAFYTEGASTNEPICAGDRMCQPFDLLREMADAGGGEAQLVQDGSAIDFSRFRIPDQRLRYQPLQVFVENANVVWEAGELKADSDADGLSDSFETAVGLNPLAATGLAGATPGLEQVSDRVAYSVCSTDLAGCAVRCLALPQSQRFDDLDSDGLNRCEETLLGSSPTLGDSIARGVPDRLAFVREMGRASSSGTPTGDADFDGRDNLTEIRDFTPMSFRNGSIPGLRPYRYSAALLPAPAGALNECYRLHVDDVRLMMQGDQDLIRAYLVEEPSLFRLSRIIRRVAAQAAAPGELNIGDWSIGGAP
jgi:hypothetical protein